MNHNSTEGIEIVGRQACDDELEVWDDDFDFDGPAIPGVFGEAGTRLASLPRAQLSMLEDLGRLSSALLLYRAPPLQHPRHPMPSDAHEDAVTATGLRIVRAQGSHIDIALALYAMSAAVAATRADAALVHVTRALDILSAAGPDPPGTAMARRLLHASLNRVLARMLTDHTDLPGANTAYTVAEGLLAPDCGAGTARGSEDSGEWFSADGDLTPENSVDGTGALFLAGRGGGRCDIAFMIDGDNLELIRGSSAELQANIADIMAALLAVDRAGVAVAAKDVVSAISAASSGILAAFRALRPYLAALTPLPTPAAAAAAAQTISSSALFTMANENTTSLQFDAHQRGAALLWEFPLLALAQARFAQLAVRVQPPSVSAAAAFSAIVRNTDAKYAPKDFNKPRSRSNRSPEHRLSGLEPRSPESDSSQSMVYEEAVMVPFPELRSVPLPWLHAVIRQLARAAITAFEALTVAALSGTAIDITPRTIGGLFAVADALLGVLGAAEHDHDRLRLTAALTEAGRAWPDVSPAEEAARATTDPLTAMTALLSCSPLPATAPVPTSARGRRTPSAANSGCTNGSGTNDSDSWDGAFGEFATPVAVPAVAPVVASDGSDLDFGDSEPFCTAKVPATPALDAAVSSDWDIEFGDNSQQDSAPPLALAGLLSQPTAVNTSNLAGSNSLPDSHVLVPAACVVRRTALPPPPELLAMRTGTGAKGHADDKYNQWLKIDIIRRINVAARERRSYHVLADIAAAADAVTVDIVQHGLARLALVDAAARDGAGETALEIVRQWFALLESHLNEPAPTGRPPAFARVAGTGPARAASADNVSFGRYSTAPVGGHRSTSSWRTDVPTTGRRGASRFSLASPETRASVFAISQRMLYTAGKLWAPSLEVTFTNWFVTAWTLGGDDGSVFSNDVPAVYAPPIQVRRQSVAYTETSVVAPLAAAGSSLGGKLECLINEVCTAPYSRTRSSSLAHASPPHELSPSDHDLPNSDFDLDIADLDTLDAPPPPPSPPPLPARMQDFSRATAAQVVRLSELSMLAHHVRDLDAQHRAQLLPDMTELVAVVVADLAAAAGTPFTHADTLAPAQAIDRLLRRLQDPVVVGALTCLPESLQPPSTPGVITPPLTCGPWLQETIFPGARAAVALASLTLLLAAISPLTGGALVVDGSDASDASDDYDVPVVTGGVPPTAWASIGHYLRDNAADRGRIMVVLLQQTPFTVARVKVLFAVAITCMDVGSPQALTQACSALYEALFVLYEQTGGRHTLPDGSAPLLSELACSVTTTYADLETLRRRSAYAIPLYDAACSVLGVRGEVDTLLRIYRRVADEAEKNHEPEIADRYYQKSFDAARRAGLLNETAYVAGVRARLQHKQGDLVGAEATITDAMTLLSSDVAWDSASDTSSHAGDSRGARYGTPAGSAGNGIIDGHITRLQLQRAAIRLDAGDLAGGIELLQHLRQLDLARARQVSVLATLATALHRAGQLKEMAEVIETMSALFFADHRAWCRVAPNALAAATVAPAFVPAHQSLFLTSVYDTMHSTTDGTRHSTADGTRQFSSLTESFSQFTESQPEQRAVSQSVVATVNRVLQLLQIAIDYYTAAGRHAAALLLIEVAGLYAVLLRRVSLIATLARTRADIISGLLATTPASAFPLVLATDIRPDEPAAGVLQVVTLGHLGAAADVHFAGADVARIPIAALAEAPVMLYCETPAALLAETVFSHAAALHWVQRHGDVLAEAAVRADLASVTASCMFGPVSFQHRSLDVVSTLDTRTSRISVITAPGVEAMLALTHPALPDVPPDETGVYTTLADFVAGPQPEPPRGRGRRARTTALTLSSGDVAGTNIAHLGSDLVRAGVLQGGKLDVAWVHQLAADVTADVTASCTDILQYINLLMTNAELIFLRGVNSQLSLAYASAALDTLYSYCLVGPVPVQCIYGGAQSAAVLAPLLRRIIAFHVAQPAPAVPALAVDALTICEVCSTNHRTNTSASTSSAIDPDFESEGEVAGSGGAGEDNADSRLTSAVQPFVQTALAVHAIRNSSHSSSPPDAPPPPFASAVNTARPAEHPGLAALTVFRRLQALHQRASAGEVSVAELGQHSLALLGGVRDLMVQLRHYAIDQALSTISEGIEPDVLATLNATNALQAVSECLADPAACADHYGALGTAVKRRVAPAGVLSPGIQLPARSANSLIKTIVNQLHNSTAQIPTFCSLVLPFYHLVWLADGSAPPLVVETSDTAFSSAQMSYIASMIASTRAAPLGPRYECRVDSAWSRIQQLRRIYAPLTASLPPVDGFVPTPVSDHNTPARMHPLAQALQVPSARAAADLRAAAHTVKPGSAGTVHLEAVRRWAMAVRALSDQWPIGLNHRESQVVGGLVGLVSSPRMLLHPWDAILGRPTARFCTLSSFCTRARRVVVADIAKELSAETERAVTALLGTHTRGALPSHVVPVVRGGGNSAARRRDLEQWWRRSLLTGVDGSACEASGTLFTTPLFKNPSAAGNSSQAPWRRKYRSMLMVEMTPSQRISDMVKSNSGTEITTLITLADLLECTDVVADAILSGASIVASAAGRMKVFAKTLSRVETIVIQAQENYSASFLEITCALLATTVTGVTTAAISPPLC